jgi:rfaE bifunctional protein kinase chain/domain
LKTYSASQLKSIFTKFNKLKVFVIGDAMIDNYWIGNIDRISPEAPVPVFTVLEKQSRPGGAANVALNCKSLGATVSLLTVIGKDEQGKSLISTLNKEGIDSSMCMQSTDRITTSKTRVLCKNQQSIRIDEEMDEELSIKDEHRFIDMCMRAIQIEVPDIVIFEDYNKGVLKQNVIEKIIVHCKLVGVLTAVDPKKKNFFAYVGADIFKPNLKEVKEALDISIKEVSLTTMNQIHVALHKKLKHKITFITLSELGVYVNETKGEKMAAHIRNIADVSGAGDTVVSIAAMCLALKLTPKAIAEMSNLGGGLVCEYVGVVPIEKEKLKAEYQKHS